MDNIQELLGRLREVWGRLSFNQRAVVGTILGASFVSVIIFGAWLRSDTMVVLYSNLGPEDGAQAIEMLSAAGVKAELRNGGGTILVPSEDVDRMRMQLAVEGIGGDGIRGWDLFDAGGMGDTDFTLNVKLKRALEGELSRSIASIEQVRAARVHINTPKHSLFVRDRQQASASVVLTLARRSPPGRDQIEGVQQLVASAVAGIEPGRVTVVDASTGRVLGGASGEDATGMSSEQLRVRKEVEDHLAGKASDILSDILGLGSYVVRVNADLDFEQLQSTRENFDPNTVVRSEQSDESTETGGGNTTNAITNYEISSTVQTVLRNGALLKKLSVAVAVDGKTLEGDDGVAAYQPRTAEELNQIQRVVSGAVGYDPARGDQIEVINMPFDAPEPYSAPLLENPLIQQLPSLVGRFLLFAVAAVLILSLRKNVGQMLATPPAPKVTAPSAGANASSAAGATGGSSGFGGVQEEVDELEAWARGNPEDVAKLVMAFASMED